MSKYWCKCGRVVNKSTNAATTGNRDTESCTGCPHLLPYGPNVWDKDKNGFVQDVQGHECRMTDHPLDYTTHISSLGGPNDKTVLHIESLDFDFLDTITEWVHDTFMQGELDGGFRRNALRGPDYMDGYRVTFYPSQNKKGVAAKQQLYHRFFHPDGTRLDKTPEEEKVKVLADIEKGKAAAQNKEIHMEDKVYKDAKGVLYRVGETGELGNADRCRLTIQQLGITPGAQWRKKSMAPNWSMAARKDAMQALEIMAEENGWKLATEAEIQYNLTERAALLDDDTDSTSLYSLDLSERTIRCLERADIDTVEELAAMSDEEIMRIRDIGRKGYEEIWAALGRAETGDAVNPTPVDDLPWSAAATAAADEPAESPAPAALTSTTETAAAVSEQTDNAAAPVPASSNTPTAFDYSGLDEQTVIDLHLAEHEYTSGKKMAEVGFRRMVEGVAIAHDALCGPVVHQVDNSKHGNRGEDSFRAWCASIGVGKTTAYKMLQVADAFMTSSTNQQKVLEQLPSTLLYDFAKPSTTEEVKQGILSGDITTHKQYQEVVARNKQYINASYMSTGTLSAVRIQSKDGKSYWDLEKNQMRLNGDFLTANGDYTLKMWGGVFNMLQRGLDRVWIFPTANDVSTGSGIVKLFSGNVVNGDLQDDLALYTDISTTNIRVGRNRAGETTGGIEVASVSTKKINNKSYVEIPNGVKVDGVQISPVNDYYGGKIEIKGSNYYCYATADGIAIRKMQTPGVMGSDDEVVFDANYLGAVQGKSFSTKTSGPVGITIDKGTFCARGTSGKETRIDGEEIYTPNLRTPIINGYGIEWVWNSSMGRYVLCAIN